MFTVAYVFPSLAYDMTSMLMRVLLADACNMMPRNEAGNELSFVSKLVHADETLVVAFGGHRASLVRSGRLHARRQPL